MSGFYIKNQNILGKTNKNRSNNLQIIGVGGAALYDFESFTFTNGTQSGTTGPSLQNLLSSYNVVENGWLENEELFSVSNGIQFWTVPASGEYLFTAVGARGGNASSAYGGGSPGLGARMVSSFSLEMGQILKILIGQEGGNGNSTNSCGADGGGGGGTFVSDIENLPIIVAGGGGGAGSSINGNLALRHAPDSQSGNSGTGSTSGAGGVNGNGGQIQSGSCVNGGASGAGFFGNGLGNGHADVAKSFVNGGVGGPGGFAAGGFGGGGGGGVQYAGGGGGGYSGGGGAGLQTCSCAQMGSGGGGGSFSANSYQYTAQIGTGHGFLTVARI